MTPIRMFAHWTTNLTVDDVIIQEGAIDFS